MKKDKEHLDIVSNVMNDKKVKVAMYVAGGVLLIFLSGYLFKTIANSVNGFREMQNAIKGI